MQKLRFIIRANEKKQKEKKYLWVLSGIFYCLLSRLTDKLLNVDSVRLTFRAKKKHHDNN